MPVRADAECAAGYPDHVWGLHICQVLARARRAVTILPVQGPWVAEHWLLWMAALSRDNNSADEFVAISRKYISTVHRANGCDSSMLSAPTWPQSRECVIEPSSLRWVV
jgi:hypothetical protein